jgi:hypothetical protein
MKDPDGIATASRQVIQRWSAVGAKGVINSHFPADPYVKRMFPVGTTTRNGKIIGNAQFTPNNLAARDRLMVKRQRIRDPENLQVKRS